MGSPDEDQRQPHFAAAAAAFAPHFRATVPGESPWRLADAAFATPLLVTRVPCWPPRVVRENGGRSRAETPVVRCGLIRGERQRWRRSAGVAGLADLEPPVADRAVAVATVTGAGN